MKDPHIGTDQWVGGEDDADLGIIVVRQKMDEDVCPLGKECLIDKGDDYIFSGRKRFDLHAKCREKQPVKTTVNDHLKVDRDIEMIDEIRSRYMPAFTREQTRLYISLHPPEDYMCCRGCRCHGDGCDCCTDRCRCCAGCCFH